MHVDKYVVVTLYWLCIPIMTLYSTYGRAWKLVVKKTLHSLLVISAERKPPSAIKGCLKCTPHHTKQPAILAKKEVYLQCFIDQTGILLHTLLSVVKWLQLFPHSLSHKKSTQHSTLLSTNTHYLLSVEVSLNKALRYYYFIMKILISTIKIL